MHSPSVKLSFIHMQIKLIMKGSAPGLALKKRDDKTRKWLVEKHSNQAATVTF